jgi:hypothetical protein
MESLVSAAAYVGAQNAPRALLFRAEVADRPAALPHVRRGAEFLYHQLKVSYGGVVGKHRQLVLLLFGVLALAGFYQAVHNLPVVTGCSFYAECPAGLNAGNR